MMEKGTFLGGEFSFSFAENFKKLRSRTLTLHFVRVRGLLFDALSLSFHKERAKEKEPRRSLLELPWCAQKLLTLCVTNVFAKCYKFSFCVGAWKSKHQHGSSTQAVKAKPSATCDAPRVRTKFKQKRERKTLPTLTCTKIPTAQQQPSDALRRMPRGFQGGKPWRVSWTLLGARQEVAIRNRSARREAVRASVEAVAEILGILLHHKHP